jgi:hypothetical protein
VGRQSRSLPCRYDFCISANPHHPLLCFHQAMIEDWRAKWVEGTGGVNDPKFPFGWAQLNSDGGATVWKAGTTQPLEAGVEDPLGMWHGGFPSLRLAEKETLSLENTFQVSSPLAHVLCLNFSCFETQRRLPLCPPTPLPPPSPTPPHPPTHHHEHQP